MPGFAPPTKICPAQAQLGRPTVTATGQFGYNYLDLITSGTAGAGAAAAAAGGSGGGVRLRRGIDTGSLGLIATQNLFNGNRTLNGVRQAEFIFLGRGYSLRDTEQNVLLNGATAYMNVLRDTAILDLRKNNIIVLEEQLRQTRDRFIVGEVTRTDVAQAELSLASARSDYFTAQANLQTSIATYRQIIGVQPTLARAGAHDREFASALARQRDRTCDCRASRDFRRPCMRRTQPPCR